MKIIIVEKDRSFSQQLERDINDFGFRVVKKLFSFNEAAAIISRELPDCVICASSLNERDSGIELASNLSHLRLPFLFTDSEPSELNYQKAKSYPLGHYLPQPFTKLTLKSVLEEFDIANFNFYSSHVLKGKYIFLKRNNIFERVDINSISRLRSEGNYTIIYDQGYQYVIKYSLSKLLKIPHFNCFLRIHRNYAIHKNKILKVDFSRRICETEEEKIPFGRTYVKNIREVMNLPYNIIV